MWELYDALIDGIPGNLKVRWAERGALRYLVMAEDAGVASIVAEGAGTVDLLRLPGRPLKDVAALCKSWNFSDACLGAAALNCYYNVSDRLLAAGAQIHLPGQRGSDAFGWYAPLVEGKKVGMVGHFGPGIQQLAGHCQLTIFEREPLEGDYPDSAAEYLLEEQEFVFITGMTFTNKTLPRLLQLSKNAEVAMVGPSVPLSPVLYEFGVKTLSGFCVTDMPLCIEAVHSSDCRQIFGCGGKVLMEKGRDFRALEEVEK